MGVAMILVLLASLTVAGELCLCYSSRCAFRLNKTATVEHNFTISEPQLHVSAFHVSPRQAVRYFRVQYDTSACYMFCTVAALKPHCLPNRDVTLVDVPAYTVAALRLVE
jgi:hypothetical protein